MTEEGKVHLRNINLWRKISIGCLFIKRRRVSVVEKKEAWKAIKIFENYYDKEGREL